VRVGQSRKRDANEGAIIDALERVGAVVFQVSAPGAPDLLVAFRGRWFPMEVKAAAGKLTPLQAGALADQGCPIVRSIDEALALLGVR
jgi:hypothetical protein